MSAPARKGGGGKQESELSPIETARKFEAALKDFAPLFKEKLADALLDLAEDGRFDTPEYRAKAERMKDTLIETLS